MDLTEHQTVEGNDCRPDSSFSEAIKMETFSTNGVGNANEGSDEGHCCSDQPESMKPSTESKFMAVYMGTIASLGGFLYGYLTGSTNNIISMSYVVEKFSANGAFTTQETAIFTSILSVGTFFGALLAPFISDRYGRRFLILWSTAIFFNLGSILQMVAHNLSVFYCGRFFSGLGVGVISAVIPLYQAETSPKWVRGSIISCYQWAITWGLFTSSAISQGTKEFHDSRCYRIPIGLEFVWGGIFVLFMWTLPESPRFYIMHDEIDRAILSLSKMRRIDVRNRELIEEMIEIKAAHDYEKSENTLSVWEFLKGFTSSKDQLKRILTGVLLNSLQQCSGINFIFYFGVDFFVRTGVSKSYLMSFVTYAVNVAFTIPGIILVETAGRRKVLIFGGIAMCLSNYIIAIVGATVDSVIADKVMLAFVCVFIAFFAATWGPVVWVITGELFPLGIRQKGVSICACTNWFINFIFAYITPYLIDNNTNKIMLGTKIFFLWGSFNLIGAIITYFLVYETQGLMLEDIDELYRRAKYSWQSSKLNKQITDEQALERERESQAIDTVNAKIPNTSTEIDDYLAMVAEEQMKQADSAETGGDLHGDLYRNPSAPSYHTDDSGTMDEFQFEGLYD